MKNRWMMSIAALLSIAGVIGAGCAAQVDEATGDALAAGEAPASEAEAEDSSLGTATEALDQQCNLDGCLRRHNPCICSNTGWAGYCGTGPHHPGCLYCRCD